MKKVPLSLLQEHEVLLISNVQDGMESHNHEILCRTADEYLHLLRKLALKSWETGCFADFYFGRLTLLADLSARELLFSTFYFTRPRCTVWGNYGLKYPVFYD